MRPRTPDPSMPAAVILAGGRSTRMGSNKALVLIGGKPLVIHVAARIALQASTVSLNADGDWPLATGLRLVPDTIEGKLGPLAGVLAALRDTAINQAATHVVTVPVDSPFFPADLLERLAEAVAGTQDIAIATSAGRDHPVFGLWPHSVADDLETWLKHDDKRRVRDFLSRHATRKVDFPMIETRQGLLDPFFNINGPDDLAAAQGWLEALGS